MSVTSRLYRANPLFGADYYILRDFLIRLDDHVYPFGRWDWMITHSYLDESGLAKIRLWEDNGELVAVATYDCKLGEAFLLMDRHHRYLGKELLLYAEVALAKQSKFRVLILDGDLELQETAARHGYFPTQDKECDSVFLISTGKSDYTLPDGFKITSMEETFDLHRYGQVLWKGFDHEAGGEGPFVFRPEDLPRWEIQFLRPNVNLSLKIAVVAPNGDFASYCGMWHDQASSCALVEPVATDPAYRKMGLGRAAVLEGIRRCRKLGAKLAYVGSSQQFYYNIGFRPYATSTWWKRHPVPVKAQ